MPIDYTHSQREAGATKRPDNSSAGTINYSHAGRRRPVASADVMSTVTRVPEANRAKRRTPYVAPPATLPLPVEASR